MSIDYAKARDAVAEGKPMGFTGVDDPYEVPAAPDFLFRPSSPQPGMTPQQIREAVDLAAQIETIGS